LHFGAGVRASTHFALLVLIALATPAPAAAQTPPQPPPPLWDAQVGGSFVGTGGNTDASTFGADFTAHRRWPQWQIEAGANTVRSTDRGERTAERYLASVRGKRVLSALIAVTAGERIERDRFAGLDLRSVLDAGLAWALVRDPRWTLDGVTSLAWNHESRIVGDDIDHPVGVLQLLSRVPFGGAGATTQRFAYFPDFKESSAYRSEAELTAQAAMTNQLALKFGYLWRFANAPVPGFEKTDHTTTASVVLSWKSATLAP
jgi:putative salt-induced outer membrane protein YdiY